MTTTSGTPRVTESDFVLKKANRQTNNNSAKINPIKNKKKITSPPCEGGVGEVSVSYSLADFSASGRVIA